MDKLDRMFEFQNELGEKFRSIEKKNGTLKSSIPVDIDTLCGQEYLRSIAWRMTEELAELMSTLKNRPWKESQYLTDKAHFEDELADLTHFFLELAISAGYNAEELCGIYIQKAQKNKWRIDTKY